MAQVGFFCSSLNGTESWLDSSNDATEDGLLEVAHKSYSTYVYRGTQVGCTPNIVTYSRNTVYNIFRQFIATARLE
ncbi:hypothetical protein L1987_47876 [Smallanthus sonchifolius]|uniref:Uncharacterized protein n=1 Tax=Smallanthus sonchifolius TaxID=185202 RepID=A0ACB9FRA4_9ASTR|nr:hypothetical protein L1987_47876 [Smallanthus sonchifolius]